VHISYLLAGAPRLPDRIFTYTLDWSPDNEACVFVSTQNGIDTILATPILL
jgi:hypothetical protein